VILGVIYLLYIVIRCQLNPALGPPLSLEERQAVTRTWIFLKVLKSLVPPMILILGVLGSIFAGIATPTEASGMGALLAFFLVIAYRRFSWSMLFETVLATTKATSMVLMVAVGATCFTGVFMGSGGGEVVSQLILGTGLGRWGVLLVMMAINFFLGMFIDWLGIVLITFPIFVPIVESLGFDVLWFVVLTAVLLQNSFLTPPFGYALIYIQGIAPVEITVEDIWSGAIPFILIMTIGFVCCLLFPELITMLPDYLVD
jgi:tripartite ATP-independent transporter DctM subunit